MSGLFELRDLLNDKKKRLSVVSTRLSLEQGGIKEKLKFKSRLLKKGKEKQLDHFKEEMAGVDKRFERERDLIKCKIKALEDKLETLENNHSSLLKSYYHPKISSLYESEEEVSEEDISLPHSYHKLKAERDALEISIASLTATIKGAEEREDEELKVMNLCLNKPVKRSIRVAKKASDIEEIKAEKRIAWQTRLTNIRMKREAFVPITDDFWLEGSKYYNQEELQAEFTLAQLRVGDNS
jgi:hypothetical protein